MTGTHARCCYLKRSAETKNKKNKRSSLSTQRAWYPTAAWWETRVCSPDLWCWSWLASRSGRKDLPWEGTPPTPLLEFYCLSANSASAKSPGWAGKPQVTEQHLQRFCWVSRLSQAFLWLGGWWSFLYMEGWCNKLWEKATRVACPEYRQVNIWFANSTASSCHSSKQCKSSNKSFHVTVAFCFISIGVFV